MWHAKNGPEVYCTASGKCMPAALLAGVGRMDFDLGEGDDDGCYAGIVGLRRWVGYAQLYARRRIKGVP